MVVLMTKLKNAIKRLPRGNECTFNLSNISINGDKRGCSGHIRLGNRCVYVDTERSCFGPLSDKFMYRVAIDEKDYSGKGGYNQWCGDTVEELVDAVMVLLCKEG